MTRLEALQALAEKVEAGDEKWVHLPRTSDLRTDLVWKAWSGSLDAAKVLHEAALPGWTWEIGPCGADLWPLEKYGDAPHASASIAPKINPARAWLLAILKVLIAQEQAKGDE